MNIGWDNWLLANEVYVRLVFFFGVLIVMGLWETTWPCRPLQVSRWYRWIRNLSLVFLNSIVLRLLFPMAAVGIAFWAQERGYGLLNNVELPLLLGTWLTVVFLDLIIYWQHVVFHHVPILWALHKMHHADPDYDVTTGGRFHPVEILLSMFIKTVAIVLIGAPAVAVIIFEILLNVSAMFNHSNIRLPLVVDKYLRAFIVTPDMHRVHHSQIRYETDSNYGFALSCWDRVFATYRSQPEKGHLGMDIGLTEYKDPKQTCSLLGMLFLPFRR